VSASESPKRRAGRSAGQATSGEDAFGTGAATDEEAEVVILEAVAPPTIDELEHLLDARDRGQGRGRKAPGPSREPVEAADPTEPATDAAPTEAAPADEDGGH
jgi:hypothetical protein